MDHDTQADPERLAATGSREPVWVRLPGEPPLYGDVRKPADPVHAASGRMQPIARPPRKTRNWRGWPQTIVAALLGAVLAIAGLQVIEDEPTVTTPGAAAPAVVTPTVPPAVTPEPAARAPLPQAPVTGTADAVAIGDAVIPSIVTVQVGAESSSGLALQGSGSGVILDVTGHVITNDHVVAAGLAFQVVLSDGRTTYDATLVGSDPLTDLAVLKIEADDLKPIVFGDTSVLRVGDTAVAVGSPLGLEGGPSLTVGVLSAFGRQVQVSQEDVLYGMLQTDAPITQGSSGGALVDTQGRLIGITTAVGVSSVGVEGIGFATPVELVERVTSEIITSGQVTHAFLGITGRTSLATAEDGASVAVGVKIDSVEAGSGAAGAGLSPGDLITAIDGVAITTMDDLIVVLRYHRAGDGITVTVADDVVGSDLPITLGERPDDG